MRPTTTLWNFRSWGSWRLGSPGHIIILWAAPKSGKTFPHSLNPACHNNSNRAGWSAENWKLKTENGGQRRATVIPGAALFHSSPTPRAPPFGIHFVSFIYSSLAAFHSFWTFDDLIRLSSCFPSFPTLFQFSPFCDWRTPLAKRQQKGWRGKVLYYGKNAIEIHLPKPAAPNC